MIQKLHLTALFFALHTIALISADTNNHTETHDIQIKLAEAPDSISPIFFFSTTPAILVPVDGIPQYEKIDDNISQLINSSFTIFRENSSKTLFLNAAEQWFYTIDSSFPLTQWHKLESPPKLLIKIAHLKKNKTTETSIIPKVIMSIAPAELIQTDGEPQFIQIPQTRLTYIANSDNDIFRYSKTGKYYLLVTGRWFQSDKINGKWKRIPSEILPQDFREIPYNSTKWSVLSSIAGTTAAKIAIKSAKTPSFIKIQKKSDITLPLIFTDNPIWKEINTKKLAYLQNSTIPVFKYNNLFYCCYRAAWYSAAILGQKWSVAEKIPDDIYKITPKEYPFFTTFVRIQKVTENFVHFVFNDGYNNIYIKNKTIVYGPGIRYSSIWDNKWYPRPITYGFNVNYDPFEKKWTRCNRYLENKSTHIKWLSDNHIPYAIPIQTGNYRTSGQTTTETEEETLDDPKKEALDTRISGDWDTPVDETALDPPGRINNNEHRKTPSSRIKSNNRRIGQNKTPHSINSRQRGVSRFERYRTYNNRSLKQSYGGGRNRSGTINSRGQYQGIFH
jgi:hypothetical protein